MAISGSEDVEFDFEVSEGEFVTMTAHPPTSGQFAMMLRQQAENSMAQRLRGMFDFLAAVLDQRNYDIIEQQLHDGLDVEVVTELIEYLIEEWTARPTKARSGSQSSPRSTGRRSTAKPRAVASIT